MLSWRWIGLFNTGIFILYARAYLAFKPVEWMELRAQSISPNINHFTVKRQTISITYLALSKRQHKP